MSISADLNSVGAVVQFNLRAGREVPIPAFVEFQLPAILEDRVAGAIVRQRKPKFRDVLIRGPIFDVEGYALQVL